eukprot:g3680.t1
MASAKNDALRERTLEGSLNYYDEQRCVGTANDKAIAARLGGHNWNIMNNGEKDEIYLRQLRNSDHFVDKNNRTTNKWFQRKRCFPRDPREPVKHCMTSLDDHPKVADKECRRLELHLSQLENHQNFGDFQRRRHELRPNGSPRPNRRNLTDVSAAFSKCKTANTYTQSVHTTADGQDLLAQQIYKSRQRRTKTSTKTPSREGDGGISSASCCDGVDDEKVTERAHAEDEAFTVYQVVGRNSTGGVIYEQFIVQPGDPGYNGVLYDGYLLPSKNPDGIPAQKLARIAADEQAQAQGKPQGGVSTKAAYEPVTLPPSACGNGKGIVSQFFGSPKQPHLTEEKFVEVLSEGLGEHRKGERELPAAWHAWRKENPGYTFNFFNSARAVEYLKEHFDPRILRAFNAIKSGAYKKDLFQLCVMYRDGGFFIDVKIGPVAGVEEQEERNALSAEERRAKQGGTHLTGNLDAVLEKLAAIPSNYAATKKLMYASKQAKLAHEKYQQQDEALVKNAKKLREDESAHEDFYAERTNPETARQSSIETVGFSAACQHLGKMDQGMVMNAVTYAKPRNPAVGEIIHSILMSVERHDEHLENKWALTGPVAYFRALTGTLPAFPKKHKKRFEEAERIHTLQGKLHTKALECHELDGGVGQVKTLLWNNEDLASEMWLAVPDSFAAKKDGSLQPLNEKGETVALVAGGSCAPGTSFGGSCGDGPATNGGTVIDSKRADYNKELAIFRKVVFTDPGEGWIGLGGDAYTKKLEEKPSCVGDEKFVLTPIFEDRIPNYDFSVTRKNNNYSSEDKLLRADSYYRKPRLGVSNPSVKYDIINNSVHPFKYS